jgi:hypothetical protein
MILTGSHRPLSDIEDLELRRDRLAELIALDLVSPSLSDQITRAIDQIDAQITGIRHEQWSRKAA